MSNQQLLSLVIIVLPVVISLAGAAYKRMMESMPSNKRAVISEVVDTAVHAVEQMYGGMNASPADKKAKAVEFATGALKELHVSVPNTLVEALIEDCVFYLNAKEIPGTPPVGFTPPQK